MSSSESPEGSDVSLYRGEVSSTQCSPSPQTACWLPQTSSACTVLQVLPSLNSSKPTHLEIRDLSIALFRAGVIRELHVPEAGEPVHQGWVLLDHCIKDILGKKGERTAGWGRQHGSSASAVLTECSKAGHLGGGTVTWSASEVDSMLISSRSAVSRHTCSQPRWRRRSSMSRITPGCQGGGHWVTEPLQKWSTPACMPLASQHAASHPHNSAVAAPSWPPDSPASPQPSPASLHEVPPQLDAPSGSRTCAGSPHSPVLKPRPRAGHGLWFFQRLPKYQSLWFSTSPITCLSGETEGYGCMSCCRFKEPKQTHCVGAVADGDCQGSSGSQGHLVLTRKLPKDSPELSDVSGKGDVGVQDNDLGKVGGQCLGKRQLHQPVDARVVLVGDPRHLWLQGDTASGLGTAMAFPCLGRIAAPCRGQQRHNTAVEPAEPGALSPAAAMAATHLTP